MKKSFVILLVFLISCSGKSQYQLLDISGHLPDLKFSLIDDNSQKVTEKNYHNSIVMLYFGFAGCGSACPLALAKLKQTIQGMGDSADDVRIIFITINPENDTPEILHSYLAAYDPQHMRGMTGAADDIEAMAKKYRVAYEKVSGSNSPHSNIIYIFDKSGKARLLATPEDSAEKITHDLNLLAHE